MLDQPNQSVPTAIRAPEPVSVLGNEPGVEARWTAWIERGRQHDIAGRRELRFLVLGILAVGAIGAYVTMGGVR